MTMIYRFDSEIPPIMPLRLKVEVNTREHFSVFGFMRKPFAVDSPWFRGSLDLLSYEREKCLRRTSERSISEARGGISPIWPRLSNAFRG